MIAVASLVLAQTALKPYVLAGFQVALPAPPVPKDADDPSANTRSWFAQSSEGPLVIVAYAEAEDEATDDKRPVQFVGGLMRSAHGVLTDQKDLLLDGWLGLESSLRMPKGLAWSRSYAFPHAFLNVTVVGTKAAKPLADAVFASLRIDPKRGSGPHKEAGPVWARVATGPSYTVDYPAKPEKHDLGNPAGASLVGWLATYGNRYYATYIGRLPSGTSLSSSDDLYEIAKATNTQAAAAAHATIVDRKATTVLGRPSETLEATNPDGATTTIFQTTVTPEGSVMLAAIVPTCWKGSPEVVRFLASLKPNDGKPTRGDESRQAGGTDRK